MGYGYVFIAICFAFAGGIVGRIKGSSFWLWFLISGLVPVFGLLAAIAYRFERDELRRACPRCGHVTKIYDALCMRCGMELELPEVAIVPESMQASRPSRRRRGHDDGRRAGHDDGRRAGHDDGQERYAAAAPPAAAQEGQSPQISS